MESGLGPENSLEQGQGTSYLEREEQLSPEWSMAHGVHAGGEEEASLAPTV